MKPGRESNFAGILEGKLARELAKEKPDPLAVSLLRCYSGDFSELLRAASMLLEGLAAGRADKLGTEARQVAYWLAHITNEWRTGQAAHLEDALGWTRPKKFHGKATSSKARLQWPVYVEIGRALESGAVIPGVFRDVGKKHGLSQSLAEKWYYEFENKYRVFAGRLAVRSQKKKQINEKTRKT